MRKLNIAKEVVRKFVDDGLYIQVIEEKDYLPVYKGKDFSKAWKAIQKYKSVSVEVYKTTELYIGNIFITTRDHNCFVSRDFTIFSNIKECNGDYLEEVLENVYEYQKN